VKNTLLQTAFSANLPTEFEQVSEIALESNFPRW